MIAAGSLAKEGAGNHCEAGARSLFNQRAFDWLDMVLNDRGHCRLPNGGVDEEVTSARVAKRRVDSQKAGRLSDGSPQLT